MKRYIVFSTEFPPYDGCMSKKGGIGDEMWNICRVLNEKGLLLCALARRKTFLDRVFDKKQEFKIYRILFWKNLKYIAISYFLLKFRLIYGKFIFLISCVDNAFIPVILRKVLEIEVIIFAHGNEIYKFGKSRKNRKIFSLKNADLIVSNSSYTKNLLLRIGVGESKIYVMNPGINLKRHFADLNKLRNLKMRLNLSERDIVILTLARVIERKGQDKMLKLLVKLLKEYNNLKYIIAGTGDYLNNLKILTKNLGIEKNVIFTGFIPEYEVQYYYTLADIYVMLSRDIQDKGDVEGFGISFLEANLYGLPVIGGRSGGIVDAIEDGVNGFLVNPDNDDEIISKIKCLIEDTQLREKIIKRSYNRLKKFDWNVLIEGFLKRIKGEF